MADGFEDWARSEIRRLRDEADHLERTLTRFLSAATRTPRNDTALAPLSSRRRSTKNDVILAAIDRAGPNGLGLEEIEQVASAAGITSNRNALRSFCWNEKKQGRLVQPSVGRFATARPQPDEAAGALSEGTTPAASNPDHNQHRQGDAGGGT